MRQIMRRSMLAATLLLATLAAPALADLRLVMVEEAGCAWCARWHAEIGPIYPKSTEGAAAPLLQVDIHDARDSGITFHKRLSYTPTFVLIRDDAEIGRLEGYPGADFFWPIVADMIATAEQGDDG